MVPKFTGLNLIGLRDKKCSISDNLSSLEYYCQQHRIPYKLLGEDCLRPKNKKKNGLNRNYDNLICIQPFELINVDLSNLRNKTHVLWVWEYPSLPDIFLKLEKYFDHLFTVSQYCVQIFEKHLQIPVSILPIQSPILKYLSLIPKHNIENCTVSKVIQQIQGTTVFGYCFDFNSSLVRKNPLNLVSAFNTVFFNSDNYSLILKFRRPKYKLKFELEAYNSFNNLISKNKSIYPIDEELSHLDLYKLYTYFDYYISPHSCEGFGLTIFDNLKLGNKIISNFYSGEKDFLVPGEFIELKHTLREFPELQHVPAYKYLPDFVSSYISEEEIVECFQQLDNYQ